VRHARVKRAGKRSTRGRVDSPPRLNRIATEAATPRARVGRNTRWILLGILGLGLLVRLLHFWTIAGTAFPKLPLVSTNSDMYANWQWAQRILAGDWLGRATYHPYFDWMKAIAPLETWYRWWGGKEIFQQAPLYPYLLAGLLALCGGSVTWVLLPQLLIGASQPLIMYQLAASLYDTRVGLVAAALTALYGPFVFHQGVLLRDWLPPLLGPLALLALLKAREIRRGWAWGTAGAALALALLAKETLLLFLPLAGLWILLDHRMAWREVARAWIGIGLGLLLFLSPLLLRNAVVGAPPFALSNRAAETFIEGNAADGNPVTMVIPPSMPGILERSQGRLWAVLQGVLATYHGRWTSFFQVQLLKLRAVTDPFESPNNVSFAYGLELSPLLRMTLGYGIVFPLAVAGLLVSLKGRWRQHSLVAFYGLSVVGGLTATMVLGRYRLDLVPVLILYAAALLVYLAEAVRERNGRRAVVTIGLIVAASLTQQTVVPLSEGMKVRVHSPEYRYSAEIYAREQQFDRAVMETARFLAHARASPLLSGFVPKIEIEYRQLLARRFIAQGAREEARQQIDLALAILARVPQPYSDTYLKFGQLYLLLGEATKARPFLARFLELEPDYSGAGELRDLLSRLGGSP
jgi:hypothetical protein